ncbi:MAG: DUF998 domain-containing protein [Halobacteriales archaeon]
METRRTVALSAPAGVLVAATGIGIAALLTPLDPLTQAISELGAPEAPYSAVMNISFIVGGVVSLPFGALLASEARNVYERAGAFFVSVAFLALTALGVFPIGRSYHIPAAITLYASFTIALWVHGTGEVLADEKRRGLATVWLGNFNVIVWASWAFWRVYAPGLALPEALGVSMFVVWILVTTRRFYNSNA